MRCILLIAIFAIGAAVDNYNVEDHLDVDALASNPDELKAFLDCFADLGPCTQVTQALKDISQEAVDQACARCTDRQKYQFWHLLKAVKKALPDRYNEYRHHYDPENKKFDALEKEISKYDKAF